MARPHVLYFSLSQLDVGGAETHILQLLQGVTGYRLSVAGVLGERFRLAVEQHGAQAYLLPPTHKYDLVAVWRYAALFRRLGVDILHTHDTRGGLLGRIAGRLAGCKVVHTVHMSSLFWNDRWPRNWLHGGAEYLLARLTHRTIFVANPIYQLYLAKGIVSASKACYVPNGIDLAFFAEAQQPGYTSMTQLRQAWGINQNEAILLFVGRYSFQKGLESLVSALGRIAADHPLVRLVLLGEGPEREKLTQHIARLGLQGRVTMTGFRPSTEVMAWLQMSTVFVLPSLFECLPYTLLEAMAAGLPCIASNVGGNVDLIQDGETGLTVEPGDVDSLTRALRRLLEDADLRVRLGQNARAKAQEFPVEKMIARTTQVYQEVLDGSRARH